MKAYTVRIETSVLVDAEDMGYFEEGELTPDRAIEIAIAWLEESLTNSNAVATVLDEDGTILKTEEL